jgi:DNA polymerase III subunit beta
MELSLSKKDLLRLLSRMQSVAERKSSMPALSSVLIAVDGADTVRLAATDLYLALLGRVRADISKPGSVAVSAKDLFERVKMMPDGPVIIAVASGSAVTLKSKGSARRYTLRGMPGEEFPPFPTAPEGESMEVPPQVLKELIEKTVFSISTDETRANLNSALLECQGETIRMVTTDGHRLSKAEATIAGKKLTATMLVPHKAIIELRNLCDELMASEPGGSEEAPSGEGKAGKEKKAEKKPASEKKNSVVITQSGPNAFFQFGSINFSVKLVEAQFPPYGQVIPASTDKRVVVNRQELVSALRAVSIAASDRTGGVKVQIQAGNMRITSESPESGDGFDELAVEYDGAPVTIGFNAKYFLDVLTALGDEEVALLLNGELDPAVVRPAKPVEGRDYLAVVMPMRI